MATRHTAHHHKLATQLTELAFAAPQVIAHRTARMAQAGPALSLRDQKEFMRMGSEKVAAFCQSWANMWTAGLSAQMDVMRALAAGGPSAALAASNATMSVMSAGMAPVHKAAVANARRLGRHGR